MKFEELQQVAVRPRDRSESLARSIYRYPSIRLTWWLLDTRVSPNLVTVSAILLAGLGACLLALGGLGAAITGAVFLHCALVLSAVDGELARARGDSSWTGVFFEHLAQRWFIPLLLVSGLAVRAIVVHGAGWALIPAVLAFMAWPPYLSAARNWLWVQRLRDGSDVRDASAGASTAPEPGKRGNELLEAAREVASGQPHALTHLVTLGVIIDAILTAILGHLAVGFLDLLLFYIAFVGPVLELLPLFRSRLDAHLGARYREVLSAVVDPEYVNDPNVRAMDPGPPGSDPS